MTQNDLPLSAAVMTSLLTCVACEACDALRHATLTADDEPDGDGAAAPLPDVSLPGCCCPQPAIKAAAPAITAARTGTLRMLTPSSFVPLPGLDAARPVPVPVPGSRFRFRVPGSGFPGLESLTKLGFRLISSGPGQTAFPADACLIQLSPILTV